MVNQINREPLPELGITPVESEIARENEIRKVPGAVINGVLEDLDSQYEQDHDRDDGGDRPKGNTLH